MVRESGVPEITLKYFERVENPASHPVWSSSTWSSVPSGARRSTPTTPAAPSPAWQPALDWTPTRTCYAMPWRRRRQPTRNRPASSPPSCATPTAAPSPSACTFTSCPRPHPGWLVIEGVFGPAARDGRAVSAGVGRRESGGKLGPRTRPDYAARDRVVAGQGLCGRDRIRTCVGNAGDFTGRPAVFPRVPFHPLLLPITASDQHRWPVSCSRCPPTAPSVPACHARPSVGRREGGGKSQPHLTERVDNDTQAFRRRMMAAGCRLSRLPAAVKQARLSRRLWVLPLRAVKPWPPPRNAQARYGSWFPPPGRLRASGS
jgi:hypothetical protein